MLGDWWRRPPPFLHADSELACVSPESVRTPRRDPLSTHRRETRLARTEESRSRTCSCRVNVQMNSGGRQTGLGGDPVGPTFVLEVGQRRTLKGLAILILCCVFLRVVDEGSSFSGKHTLPEGCVPWCGVATSRPSDRPALGESPLGKLFVASSTQLFFQARA